MTKSIKITVVSLCLLISMAFVSEISAIGFLISGSFDGTTKMWNIKEGKCFKVVKYLAKDLISITWRLRLKETKEAKRFKKKLLERTKDKKLTDVTVYTQE